MNLFKLEKLKIEAYSTSRRSLGDRRGTFEAMFNPASFSQKYEIAYAKDAGLGIGNEKVDYQRSKPSVLTLTLVLDGTGVSEFGLSALLRRKTVAARVKEFLDLTYRVNGAIHEPNYLTVKWGGGLTFACRLGSVNINYTTLDRDGSPLRAELEATFLSDADVKKLMRTANLTSPDLTHRLVVKEGDTLPLLSQQVYGSSQHYLMVAAANGLDDFRDLRPGMELAFPPLQNPSAEDGAAGDGTSA
jgi:LysM repeat protein